MQEHKFLLEYTHKSSSRMKKLWLDELFGLNDYLYRTMGEDHLLDIPYNDEEKDFHETGISSRMSMKPTRDGKTALDRWGNYFCTNRILRGLIDRVELFESRYADSTTYMSILVIAILKLIYSNDFDIDVKKFINYAKTTILDSIKSLDGDINKENYIRTCLSCLDQETIQAVVDLIMNNSESHIQIIQNGYPKYANYQGHIAVEKSDGSKILTLHSLPSLDFNGKSRLLVVNGVITFDDLCKFIDLNDTFIRNVCNKAIEEQNLVAPLILLAKHVDYGSKKLLDLIQQYGIILIAHNNNDSLQCRELLSKCGRTICVDLLQKIDDEFIPEAVRVSLKTTEKFQNKIFYINEDVHKSFAPNEIDIIRQSIESELRHPLTDFRKAELATMTHLICSNSINVYLGGFECRYMKSVYFDKLYDVVSANSKGLLSKTTKCIYSTLRDIEDAVPLCGFCSVANCQNSKCFLNKLLSNINGRFDAYCYSRSEVSKDSIRDLYASIYYATSYAFDFSWDVYRTTFMMKFNHKIDKKDCLFLHELNKPKNKKNIGFVYETNNIEEEE